LPPTIERNQEIAQATIWGNGTDVGGAQSLMDGHWEEREVSDEERSRRNGIRTENMGGPQKKTNSRRGR